MSNYKMIVMDMDDTLINSENKVSKETKKLLDRYSKPRL